MHCNKAHQFRRDLSEGGYMSGELMPSERSYFASEDPFKGTPAEFKETFDRFIGYYGKYEIDSEKSTVKHYVEGSMFPSWEGQVQERFFELSDNLLTLSTPPLSCGNENAAGVLGRKLNKNLNFQDIKSSSF
jgi:hypothetical protein